MEAEQFDYRRESQTNCNMIVKIEPCVYAKSPKNDVIGDVSVEVWVVFAPWRVDETRPAM